MEQTWRWFGPDDVIRLADIRQAGATGIVTALHQIPYGVVWSVDEIEKRKALIGAEPSLGLSWSVVESLPVHEAIKIGEGDLDPLFDNYRQSCATSPPAEWTVCYNFMPVLDWTRTELAHPLPAGAGRSDSTRRSSPRSTVSCWSARAPRPITSPRLSTGPGSGSAERRRATSEHSATIMAGLPGAFDRYDIPGLRRMLDRYREVPAARLRENLARFLRQVIPTAEEIGVRMAIHPDDPPRPLMGLPRIVSGEDDLAFIVEAIDSPANGITLCSGSSARGPTTTCRGSRAASRPNVHFAHLRNVAKEPDGSFMEADHLGGDTDMVALVDVLLGEQKRRRDAGDPRWRIPMRPDHGHELLDDIGKATHPGYPMIGRLKGLAELRGVMQALAAIRGLPL